MKKRKDERLYTTLDAYRAGYLTTKGHSPTLIKENDKIVFVFPLTIKIKNDIDDYENGALVDALKFSLAVKALKTRIHSLRQERNSNAR